MKSTFKKLPGSKIELNVALDAKEFLAYYEAELEVARKSVHLKGFRPGTAPKELADQAIDKEEVFSRAAEKAVRSSFKDVVEENEWIVIDQPKVTIKDASKNKEIGLEYEVELVVLPDVELPDYKKIAKKIFEEKKQVVVEEKEITQTLEWLQESRAPLIRVEREARSGDVAEGDIEGTADGKPLPEAMLRNDRFLLGKSHFIPGFDEKVVGHKGGEELKFSLVAPADFWKKELQNKTVDFTVKLKGIFERALAPLDDAFAKTLGPQFQTIEDVKKNITEGIKFEKEEKEQERLRIKILKEIGSRARVDIPEIMIERTIDMMLQELKTMLKESGKTDEELRIGLRERAKENVTNHLVIQKLAKIERLEPTEEEVKEEMGRTMARNGKNVHKFRYI